METIGTWWMWAGFAVFVVVAIGIGGNLLGLPLFDPIAAAIVALPSSPLPSPRRKRGQIAYCRPCCVVCNGR